MNKEERTAPKYAYCNIKRIAVPNQVKDFTSEYRNIELVDTLPDNCIRLRSSKGWCGVVCKECMV